MGFFRRLFNSWRKKKQVEPVVLPTPVQHKPWAQDRPVAIEDSNPIVALREHESMPYQGKGGRASATFTHDRTYSRPKVPPPAPPPPPAWKRDRSYTPQVASSAPVSRHDDTDYITPMIVASVLLSDSGNNRCDTQDSPTSSSSDSSPSSCD